MADERKRCPKCGADFDHVVCDGEVLQFKCGTLQGRTKTERVIESEDCLRRQLARAQEQLQQALAREAELRRVLEQVQWLSLVNVIPPFCPICRRGKAEGHAPDCELAAALADAPAAPPAAQERPERAFGEEGRR